MLGELIGTVGAFVCGGLISTANYFITKKMTKQEDIKAYLKSYLLRLALISLFIAALYFIAEYFDLTVWAVLLGGATGLTLPAAVLTYRLIKQKNDKGGKDN
ncbi:MAG: hypothetical protein GX148_02495 [Clostridiales bacterium]|jgi:Na+-driven multidrug efflux pump|nr:hypothetical protein [Clostridiales bacterium]